MEGAAVGAAVAVEGAAVGAAVAHTGLPACTLLQALAELLFNEQKK